MSKSNLKDVVNIKNEVEDIERKPGEGKDDDDRHLDFRPQNFLSSSPVRRQNKLERLCQGCHGTQPDDTHRTNGTAHYKKCK